MRNIVMITGLLLGVACMAQGTSAEAYFNQASKEYVKQDKITALRTLDNGLRQYPGDPRLLKLAEELIKEDEQEQEQQQQQDQQKQEQQDQEDQRKGDKQQQQQQKEEQQKEQEKQAEKQKQQNADKGEEKEQQPGAGTIAPQDALRMLDALERSEEDVQEKVRAKLRPAVRRPIEKDW
ncbi:MAG: hypothetical protein R2818_01865 [Flavobacteriales bacterium]